MHKMLTPNVVCCRGLILFCLRTLINHNGGRARRFLPSTLFPLPVFVILIEGANATHSHPKWKTIKDKQLRQADTTDVDSNAKYATVFDVRPGTEALKKERKK